MADVGLLDVTETARRPAAKRAPAKNAQFKRPRQRAAHAVRSKPISLSAETSVDTAIAVIVAATRDHWVANEPALMAGQVEGVHQFRVGLRRFRSALSLFKKHLPKSQREWLNAEAKWVLSEFGPTRDLDVLLTQLIPIATKAADAEKFEALTAAAAQARRAALTVALRALKAPRYQRFVNRLDTWIAGAGWRAARDESRRDGGKEDAAAFAERAIEKRVLKILGRGKSLEEMSSADRHDIRIAIKKCRYGIEFFAEVLPKRALARKLKSLQDDLGHSNDVDVAQDMIAALTAHSKDRAEKAALAKAGRALIAHYRRLEKKSRPEAAKHWRNLRAAVLS